MLNDDQFAQVTHCRLREEGRQPDDRARAGRVLLPVVQQLGVVIRCGVPGLVEGVVDNDLPAAFVRSQRSVRQRPNVAVNHIASPMRVAPEEFVPDKQLVSILDAQFVEEDLPNHPHLIARIILMLCRSKDRFGVHAGKLDRNRRIRRIVANLDLPHLRRPGLALLQDQRGLLARDRRTDSAMVQRRQTRGRKRPQRSHPWHQRR